MAHSLAGISEEGGNALKGTFLSTYLLQGSYLGCTTNPTF